ncbi:MAG: HDOD domain-containing protein [Candidatus Pacebacteria bacterium]|jgi:HD-like signal output (HDOD) protein|nr:HDOD domain-containing protein [Candidatus Paceibacterota bacterium]|tara:strand:- start:2187 stop:3125 length:939 start_codon:yes stop_codon:yes gene_type:complete
MSKSKAEETIANLEQIPAIPSSVIRLIRILDDPDSSIDDIVSSIETSTCAKVLSIANTAYYSRLRRVESIEHSIAILGRNTVRDIVLGITISSMFSVESYDILYGEYKKFWHRTITATQLAMMFGKVLRSPNLSKIYTVSLIHDIGELVLLMYLKEDYKKVQEEIEKGNLSPVEAEKKIIGLSHAEIGKLLAEKWNFPEDMTRIINFHVDPQRLKDDLDELKLGMIIHAADSLTNELFKSPEWEEIFEDEIRLKSLFSSMNSLASTLMNEFLKNTQQASALKDWENVFDEELLIASEAIKPIMETLLTRTKK